MRLTTSALVALAVTLACFAGTASANPPQQWEQETVESLLLSPDTSQRVVFLHQAPAATCVDSQGFTRFADCPDITWVCPVGITHGALDRLARDVSYNRQIAGFAARDTMCMPQTPALNPQPSTSPPPTKPADPPVLAFTGNETNVLGSLGASLIGLGAIALGARRRIQ